MATLNQWFQRVLRRASPTVTDAAVRDDPLAHIRRIIEAKDIPRAFGLLNQLKAQRKPQRDVDYLRALCFVRNRQTPPAKEALKEELRYFPENETAAKLLKSLETGAAPRAPGNDREYQEILEVIRPYTMVGAARLHSLFTLARDVCARDVEGNFVECGVAAGGSSALLAAVIARHSHRPRRLFSFDTFSGMPTPTDQDTHAGQHAEETGWGSGTCAAPEASLRQVCGRLGVEQLVEPVAGLFADTLPVHRNRIGPIAFLHMDGDWYSSTRDILQNLYDQVVPGARIQIDDYGYWEGCQRAVSEFERERGLKFQLNIIDETGVWLSR